MQEMILESALLQEWMTMMMGVTELDYLLMICISGRLATMMFQKVTANQVEVTYDNDLVL